MKQYRPPQYRVSIRSQKKRRGGFFRMRSSHAAGRHRMVPISSHAGANPYRRYSSGFSQKVRIELTILVGCILATAAILIYHPFFHIRNVSVRGVSRLSEQEVEGAVFGVMSYRRWFIFPAKSYPFVNQQEIRDVLFNRFSLNEATVQKEFPNTITITIDEKVSTVLYDNGTAYAYMDRGGAVVEPLRKLGPDEWMPTFTTATSTNANGEEITSRVESGRAHTPDVTRLHAEFGTMPIVFDTRTAKKGSDITVTPETMAGIIDWYYFLEKEMGVSIAYAQIGQDNESGFLQTNAGWKVIATFDRADAAQFEKIKTVLTQADISISTLEYIDIRFPERVYWK